MDDEGWRTRLNEVHEWFATAWKSAPSKTRQYITIDNLYLLIMILVSFIPMIAPKYISFESVSYILLSIPGPVSVLYLLYMHGRAFLNLLESSGGKVVYALVLAVNLTLASVVADQIIRVEINTHPDQFSSAKQALSAALFMYITITEFSVVCLILVVFNIVVMTLSGTLNKISTLIGVSFNKVSLKANFIQFSSHLFASYFLLYFNTMSTITFGFKDDQGRSMYLSDLLILYSSFVPNRLGEDYRNTDISMHSNPRTKLFCENIPEEYYISPANPDDEIPSRVVTAIFKAQPGGVVKLSYRLAICENSNDPDRIRMRKPSDD